MARKILLADDSVTAQNMGRKILADAGYEVITVNNGSAALKKIAEHRPDLIVLDVYMPGYSGLEVCQRLKEVGETSRIPVLLTVGKLEPFKPDEAKRVRADGFIVKPFEASELLSALSKLEDKIVPRAESAKPGRLARATAAIDEGRQDKAATSEDDSSWKNRIAFPSKKKEATAEADTDESAIYNPINKDLRTVVDHKPVETLKAPVQEARVDLGALASDGLPKDVTPEEIAALAAAAAQVKIAEENAAAEFDAVAAPAVEAKSNPTESLPTVEPVADAPATVASAPQNEDPEEKMAEAVIPPTPAEVTAAITELEKHSDEPVTMAMSAAAGREFSAASSRWTAVAVALAPDETGLSLEQEMQQSFAAFASPEPASATYGSPASETTSISEPIAEAASAVDAVAEPVAVAAETEAAFTTAEAQISEQPAAETIAPEIVSSENSPVADSSWTVPAEAVEDQTPQAVAESIAAEETFVPQQEEVAQPEVGHEEAQPEPGVKDFAVVAAPAEQPVAEASAYPSDFTHDPAAPEAEAPAAEVQKKEPDIAATTAAAWASWRRTRETGNGHSPEDAKDAAAMAVAAGAESAPEEVSNSMESDPSIASIVDSMLADLRPRIVEEISRKLGKKK